MAQANSNFSLVGNITRDPEIRLTTKQTKYCFVTVAINKNKDVTDFVSVLVWDKLAENLQKYCKKGDCIAISGYVGTMKRDGKTEIQLTADSFTICYGRKSDKAESAPKAEAPNPVEDKFEALTAQDPFAPF